MCLQASTHCRRSLLIFSRISGESLGCPMVIRSCRNWATCPLRSPIICDIYNQIDCCAVRINLIMRNLLVSKQRESIKRTTKYHRVRMRSTARYNEPLRVYRYSIKIRSSFHPAVLFPIILLDQEANDSRKREHFGKKGFRPII